jgi:predicted nucleic acid-binding protein
VGEIRRRCWDTQACLAWLNSEPEWNAGCKLALDEAAAGRIEIVVSALALVEVLYVRGQPPIKRDHAAKITQFFQQPFFTIVNVDRRIAERARDVHWDHGVSTRDAVHVATALEAAAECLETCDGPLVKLSGKVGGTPTLVICKPGAGLQETLQLESPAKVAEKPRSAERNSKSR